MELSAGIIVLIAIAASCILCNKKDADNEGGDREDSGLYRKVIKKSDKKIKKFSNKETLCWSFD